MIPESQLRKAISGDITEQDSIIIELMPQVMDIIRGLSRGNQRYRLELESIGLFTLVKTVRERKEYHSAFDLYIFRTVRGRLLDYLRSERRQYRISGTDAQLAYIKSKTHIGNTINEELEDLRISTFDKRIIMLRLDGHSFRKIASELNCSIGLIHKTLKRIKDEYNQRENYYSKKMS